MKNRHVHILAAVLTAFGLAVFAYKAIVAGFPVFTGELTQAWEIETRIQLEGNGKPVRVETFVPRNRPGVHVSDQRFIGKGFGITREETPLNRRVILATRKSASLQTVYVRFVVRRFAVSEESESAPEPRLRAAKLDDVALTAAQDLIALAHQRSADTQTFVSALLKAMKDRTDQGVVTEIQGEKDTLAAQADAVIAVLSVARIAARRVNGIDLGQDKRSAPVVRWIEVYDDGVWRPYSLFTGENSVPASYLPWWYGDAPLVNVTGSSKPVRTVSFQRVQEPILNKVLAEGREQGSPLVTLSLFGLPVATQQVYRILTVVPLGIFILVLLRNVVGLRTLGTFMPVLIALAFRETRLLWGIILFTSVVGAGLLFRAYLEHLKLLLVPRLASVLIFVVLFMAGLSVVAAQLKLEGGLSVALFPMVIMTMTIERVSVIWDELGPQPALKQAAASLVVAAFCYLVMSQAFVQHLFFTFPELLLVMLAGTLILGRYSGYRLVELSRFRVLAGDDR